jgi:hypothetical protein
MHTYTLTQHIQTPEADIIYHVKCQLYDVVSGSYFPTFIEETQVVGVHLGAIESLLKPEVMYD